MIGNPSLGCNQATLGHFLFGHFAFHSHTDDCLHCNLIGFFLNLAPAHCRSEQEKLQQFVVNCKHPLPKTFLTQSHAG